MAAGAGVQAAMKAGPAIGAFSAGITSLAGGWLAGKSANKGYNEYIDLMNQRLSEIKAHRDNKYYQDPTKTAESMAAVTQAQEILNQQNEADRNRQIISGGTDESRALAKQAGAATVGNMMQQQAVAGAADKERIWNNADSQIDAFTKYKADALKAKYLTKAQNTSNMANNLAASQVEVGRAVGDMSSM